MRLHGARCIETASSLSISKAQGEIAMHLSQLTIHGFRRLKTLELSFRQGLNVIVGPNNAGKTAVVDALRVLLSNGDEGALRVTESDLHIGPDGTRSPQATLTYVFGGLDMEEEADFLTALKPAIAADGTTVYEAHFTVRFTNPDDGGRLRVRRWAGDHEDNPITSEMLEDLRATYLPPLRDPAQGLKPGRGSQLARLVHRLSDPATRQEVVDSLANFDIELQGAQPVADAQAAIIKRHLEMLGPVLSQALAVSLSPNNFQRMAARLALAVADLEVEQNGLGFNNLIYMAVVLSELSLSRDAAYRSLIVEEPEAHLHPQLQAVLLEYLQSVQTPGAGEKPVQVFVTSHSPNFAALADLDSICCVYEHEGVIEAFYPRMVNFERAKKEKLQRYLNVTRADLFFARKIVLVEGAAELFLVEAMARKAGLDLRKHAVSVISTDGLNFDAFLPLFGVNALKIPVAVITDADPDANSFPAIGAPLVLSNAARSIAARADAHVQVFIAQKTFEYDLGLLPQNRGALLAALEDLHPLICGSLTTQVQAADEADRAKVLFKGMFARPEGSKNVMKGAYGQTLAHVIANSDVVFDAPVYFRQALEYVTAD